MYKNSKKKGCFLGACIKACYENPLFEEDGTGIGDTHTKIHGRTDGIRSKPYELQAAQTSVHFRQKTSGKRKRLYVLLIVVLVAIAIGIVAAIIYGQRDGSSSSEADQSNVSYTREVRGTLRIVKGPFSTYTREYSNQRSVLYSKFVSSFTYQMEIIFNRTEFTTSYSGTEIVNMTSGSVIVNFIIHFSRDVQITHSFHRMFADIITRGLEPTLFVIDVDSIKLHAVELALSVITTPTPGVCIPLMSPFCTNETSWSYTTFPNLLNHTSMPEADAAMAKQEMIFASACGKDFWCSVFTPKCNSVGPIKPCKDYCKAVFTSCGANGMYDDDIKRLINCDDLPDSTDPNVCVQDPYKPGTCHDYKDPICEGVSSGRVIVPNFSGQRTPELASSTSLNLLVSINHSTHCYKYTVLFACSALLPNCPTNPRSSKFYGVPPCKSLCKAFRTRCEIFMDIFWYPWPEKLDCDSYPDVNDTSVCIGYKETHEPPAPFRGCPYDEKRCDNTSCIPMSWQCDDYKDCKDGSDEKPIQTTFPLKRCAVCPDDMFRCTPKSTICVENTKRCDGIPDCPTGSDEMECGKCETFTDENDCGMCDVLTDGMEFVKLGDGGRQGILTVYNPNNSQYEEVCTDGWQESHSQLICSQIGYKTVQGIAKVSNTTASTFVVSERRNDTEPDLIQSNLTRSGTCATGKVISITCYEPVCGTRPAYVRPAARIVGGDVADPEAWPWHVSIHGGSDYKYFCGATIISERWLLTASHCIGQRQNNPEYLKVIVGQPRRDTYSEWMQELRPESMYLYPEYNSLTVNNDIALIHLAEEIRFNEHVRPACLPSTSKRLPVGKRCTVIGWGKRNETAIYYERSTKQVRLEVVDQEQCRAAIEGAETKVPYRLTENMFCAGGGLGHDACSGDSGGPMLCAEDSLRRDKWFVAGIVSWGIGCAYPNVPGVYTNVPGFLEWIKNTTQIPYL